MKFKLGDKVRILDGSEIHNYVGSWTDSMDKYIGEVCMVTDVMSSLPDGRIGYSLDNNGFIWDERGLELVEAAPAPDVPETVPSEQERLIDIKKLLHTPGITVSIINTDEVDGAYVREFRRRYRISQQELANILHMQKDTIYRWEANINEIKGCAAVLIKLLNNNPILFKQVYEVDEIG